MLLARMVQNPDVLQPYVRRAQIRPRGAYREPDPGRARSQSPLRIEPKIRVLAHGPRRARAIAANRSASENRKGNVRHHQRNSPVQRRTRGDERNGRSGTACREPGNCDTKSTRRDQIALKGNQPRQRRPRDHSASRSSRHRMQGDRRRAAMQVRLQFFATNRGPHEHEWPQPRIARVNVRGVDVEQRKRNQWVNASASTVQRTSHRMTSGRTGGRGI
jgi:hypothetical protein